MWISLKVSRWSIAKSLFSVSLRPKEVPTLYSVSGSEMSMPMKIR